jgi:hypothetical protein
VVLTVLLFGSSPPGQVLALMDTLHSDEVRTCFHECLDEWVMHGCALPHLSSLNTNRFQTFCKCQRLYHFIPLGFVQKYGEKIIWTRNDDYMWFKTMRRWYEMLVYPVYPTLTPWDNMTWRERLFPFLPATCQVSTSGFTSLSRLLKALPRPKEERCTLWSEGA